MESPKPCRRTLPKNVGLLERIRGKRERDWKPSVEELKKGFRGWHQRGYLPHFDAPGVTQFVTFQLHDAFPVARRPELEASLKEPDDSTRRRKLEVWLDRREPSAPGARPSRHFDVRLAKALEIISKPAGVREVKRRERRRAPDLREAS